MTPADFDKRMKSLAKKLVRNIDAGWRATALVVDQAVVLATPVDTGRARSNWRVSAGAPDGNVREPYVPGEGGSTAAQNTRAALAQGREAIAGAGANVRAIYISNNLPYIQPLNDGSSAQAPAGFVELAVQRGIHRALEIKALAE